MLRKPQTFFTLNWHFEVKYFVWNRQFLKEMILLDNSHNYRKIFARSPWQLGNVNLLAQSPRGFPPAIASLHTINYHYTYIIKKELSLMICCYIGYSIYSIPYYISTLPKILRKKKALKNCLLLFWLQFQVTLIWSWLSLNGTKITAASKVCVSEWRYLSKGIILLRTKIFISAKILTSNNIHASFQG